MKYDKENFNKKRILRREYENEKDQDKDKDMDIEKNLNKAKVL